MESCDDYGTGIELPERIYKRVERIMKIFTAINNFFVSLKKKEYRYVEIHGTVTKSHKQNIGGKEVTMIDEARIDSVSFVDRKTKDSHA